MNEIYPRGRDLSHIFPKPPRPLTIKQVQPLLPALFSDLCKDCHKPMELMPVVSVTRRSPFATFQCPDCKLRLCLFEAPVTPLLVWSNSFDHHPDFSAFIDEQLAKRDRDHETRAARYASQAQS